MENDILQKKSRIQIRHFVILGFDNVLVPFLKENSINLHIDTSNTDLSTMM